MKSMNESSSSVISLRCPSGPASPDLFVPPRPASAPSSQASTATGVKRLAEDDRLFSKKGNTKRTGASLMEEAVKVMK